jgi:hypothetical protein
MKQRELQFSAHGKDSDEHDASGSNNNNGVVETTKSTVAVTVTEATTTFATTSFEEGIAVEDDSMSHDKDAVEQILNYLDQFPNKPTTARAASAFSLFSDSDAFTLDKIYDKPHTVVTELKGTIWWDVNGDGKQGDYTNKTLNAMEYDYGMTNVANILLVDCESNAEIYRTTSEPKNAASSLTYPQKKTLNPYAGQYNFPLSSVSGGRYYVVYQAPKDFRVSGNVLPLDRVNEQSNSQGKTTYFECLPRGGEGAEFGDKARETGDLDYEGYCARTIGCFEVGEKSTLEERFKELVLKGSDTNTPEEGNGRNSTFLDDYSGLLVALPTPHTLDVGFSEQEWELPSYQYVDAQITLKFPSAVSLSDLKATLAESFADYDSFGVSNNRKVLAQMFTQYFRQYDANSTAASAFALEGLDLFKAEVSAAQEFASSSSNSSRYLRGSSSRRVQEAMDDSGPEITYTLTARGSYRPPPHDQLGYFLEDSINANPSVVVNSFKEQQNLPRFFSELEDVGARHLTVGPPAPLKGLGGLAAYQEDIDAHRAGAEGGMAGWATAPLIIIVLGIVSLASFFLFRRVFKRRRVVTDFGDMKAKGFAVSPHTKVDDKKRKRRKRGDDADHEDNANAVSNRSGGLQPIPQDDQEDDSSQEDAMRRNASQKEATLNERKKSKKKKQKKHHKSKRRVREEEGVMS